MTGAVTTAMRQQLLHNQDREQASGPLDNNLAPNLAHNKTKSPLPVTWLAECSTVELLKELQSRGGHPGALAEAGLLCIRKSQDYNQSSVSFDPHTVDRTAYFPFGAVSYAQMLHTKALRFNSLVLKDLRGQEANFEGLRDTALDIINYAGFFAGAYQNNQEPTPCNPTNKS